MNHKCSNCQSNNITHVKSMMIGIHTDSPKTVNVYYCKNCKKEGKYYEPFIELSNETKEKSKT